MDNYYYDDDDGDDYEALVEDYIEDEADYIKYSTPMWTSDNLWNSLMSCILPTSSQISNYVGILVGMCFILSLLSKLVRQLLQNTQKYKENIQHVLDFIFGIITLYVVLGKDVQIILCFAIFSYIFLQIFINYGNNLQRSGVLIIIISAHFCCETFWHDPEMWQRIRGIQMVAMMKTISLYYDLHALKIKNMPGILSYLGYMFFPATCVLGPWISYTNYLLNLRAANFNIRQFITFILNILLALTFLMLSNCFVPIVGDLPYITKWKWLTSYRDALSVRCSHYFICFLSQACLIAAGYTLNDTHSTLGPLVTRFWQIEWPRSLPAVVRAWNLPMHNWLRTYIFQPMQSSDNYLLAIIFTYAVSALLHGLHLRIYLVLLSLAIFGYIEYKLRAKLATIFNACIGANPCKKQLCHFQYCPYRLGYHCTAMYCVFIVNIIFSLLAIFHLAYLGILMDSSSMDDNLSAVEDIWHKWQNLNFLCHWIALVTFIFYYFI